MTEVVESNSAQLVLLQHPGEHVSGIPLFQGRAFERREHPVGHRLAVLQAPLPQQSTPHDERRREFRRHVHAPRATTTAFAIVDR
jgi:hypothetical protein